MIKVWYGCMALCCKTGKKESESLLFCFDFDQTIVKGHFHHLLCEEKKRIESTGTIFDVCKYLDVLLDDPSVGFKNQTRLRDVIKRALDNGHFVAITSFTSYPEVFTPTLLRLGLSPQDVEKIPGYSGLPNSYAAGKNEHIDHAMEHFGLKNKNLVWLIDDDGRNCSKANSNGFKSIQVPERPEDRSLLYLDEIDRVISTRSSKK